MRTRPNARVGRPTTGPLFTTFLLPLSLAIVCSLGAPRGLRAEVSADTSGDVELAARLAELSQTTLSQKVILPAHFKLAAELLHAANRLSPEDPRYPLLEAEARLQAKDADGAIDAYRAYMGIPGYGEDRVVQSAYIELQTGKMETSDAKLAYLKPMIAADNLAPEVRSRAALVMIRILFERAENAQAMTLLDQALQLDPMNLTALRMHYDMVAADGSAVDRVNTLLAMLRSNPAQFSVMASLAQQMADEGMSDESLKFYAQGLDVAQAMGLGVPREFAAAYAMETFVSNQVQVTQQIADSLLKLNPADYEVLVLRLLLQRLANDSSGADVTIAQAQNALYNRLAGFRKDMGGDKNVASRDATDTTAIDWGDLGEEVKKFPPGQNDAARQQYGELIAEIAWFQIYYNHKPAEAAPFLKTLRQLLPDDSTLLARLEGWNALIGGQKEEAAVQLTAAAAHDPLAALGMLKLSPDPDKDKAAAAANKLLSEHPAGLVASILFEALHDRGAVIIPGPNASAIRASLSSFPKEWLTILKLPKNFYVLRATPLRVAHGFGEPIYAKVTLLNASNFDIPIGPEGLIHSDVWFDAQFRGLVHDTLPGVCIARFGQQLILRKGESITQIVRLDQGQLARVLANSPVPPFEIMFSVRTNPTTTTQDGTLPGGVAMVFDKMVSRTPFNSSQIQQLITDIKGGPGAKEMRGIDLGIVLLGILQNQAGNPNAQQVAGAMLDAIRSRTTDPSPSVQAWAQFELAQYAAARDRKGDRVAVERMMSDPNWQQRMLGLTVVGALPLEQQLKIAQDAAERDTDPTVKAYAQAGVELLQAAVAQAPATQPAATQAVGQ